MPDHSYFANLIWQIADLLRGALTAHRSTSASCCR